jgi:hypothetical protein
LLLLAKASGAQARLFQSHKAAVLERARMMKRISFMIHSGRKDQFGRHLTQIIELLVEALKVPQASVLHAEVIFLIRVLLARTSPEYLTPIWPVVLMEVIRACDDSNELDVLQQACKFVDLALVLVPKQFQLYQWMFLVDKTAQLEMKDKNYAQKEINEFKNFIPHLLFLSRRIQKEKIDLPAPDLARDASFKVLASVTPSSGGLGLRRPVLTARKITNLNQLAQFHDLLCEWISSNSFNANPPDLEFIDNLLLCDFIEYGDEYEDPMLMAGLEEVPSNPSSPVLHASDSKDEDFDALDPQLAHADKVAKDDMDIDTSELSHGTRTY